MAARARAEFYIRRPGAARGRQWLFDHEGRLGWGTKAIATKFKGVVNAKRVAALARTPGVPRLQLVHA